MLERPVDGRRRAIAVLGDTVVGLAAFELLYGPRAEFALSLRDPTDPHLARELIGALARAAHALELRTLRAEIAEYQLPLARALPLTELVGDALRVDVAQWTSVVPTEHGAHLTPMASGSAVLKIV